MKNPDIRKPAVAGQFYPSSPIELKKQIQGFIKEKAEKTNAIACLLPHAGYIYSGKVAAETVSNINLKEKIILLGPNHTGLGGEFSIISKGIWQTPLGDIKINGELAQGLLKHCDILEENSAAHQYEHSLEVELPILQYFKNDFEIVPITIFSDDLNKLKKLGVAIASAITRLNAKSSTLLVASSDMTHYEPQAQAQKKDQTAIEAILKLDEDELIKKIRDLKITMCGYAPVIAMLAASKILGAKTAKLVKYQTSGDITGDYESVVGYAGIIIS